MQLQRLAQLSDFIFAGAMLLMALTFEPLPTQGMTSQAATAFLQAQLSSFGVYALTFVVIAFYWSSYIHQFQHYQKTDAIHLWLTLLSLLFIVFLPYANNLVTFYDGVFAIQVFYSLSAAGTGLFSTAAWIYATHNRRLVKQSLPAQTIRLIRQESYIEPILSVLAIAGALVHPFGWTATFIIGFPLFFGVQKLFNDKAPASPPTYVSEAGSPEGNTGK